MILKKMIIISMGIIFCATSLGYAADHRHSRAESKHARKWSIQNNHNQTHQQRYLDKKVPNKPIQFTPYLNFKSDTIMGQTILTLLVFSSIANVVSATGNNPTAMNGGKSSQNLGSSTNYDCIVSPNSQGYVPSGTLSFCESGVRNSPLLAAATTSGLREIFCPQKSQCVQVVNGQAIFSGTEKEVDAIVRKFGNFAEIRKDVIPPTPEAAKTQAYPKPKFSKPTDLMVSLGVSPEDLENMAVSDYADCRECATALGLDYDHIKDFPICSLSGTDNGIIAINYKGSDSGGMSFNQKTADFFFAFLKQESPFFKFLTDTNKKIITYTDQYIFMNYGIFNEYFSLLNPVKIDQGQGMFKITLPLDTVLKRLMAAVSGGVSLEHTSTPGEFHVRTVTLRDKEDIFTKQSIPPVVKIILDRSGSMEGGSIDTINTNVPILLGRFRDSLEIDEVLNVAIYSLNHEFSILQKFLLKKDSQIPKWERLIATGGTDLTPVGRILKIEEGESPSQMLIAITDGEHVGPNKLDAPYYSALKALQSSGSFAQSFLCRVGDGDDGFFVNMNQMFSGSYSRESNIQDCLSRVYKAVPEMLSSKEPLVLTIGGNNKVIWQQNAQSGMQKTTETVREGDDIVLGQYKAKIKVETKEEKKARLMAELSALENESQ